MQTEFVEEEEHDHTITSRINLVDLAGSERCSSAQTSEDRLRVRSLSRAWEFMPGLYSTVSPKAKSSKTVVMAYF